MNRSDIAYLINSTPNYFYIVELHVALIRRYAPQCKWPIFFATEVPENPLCSILKKYDIEVLVIDDNSTDNTVSIIKRLNIEKIKL